MRSFIARVWKQDDAAAMLEYGLLVALIAVIVMAALSPLGSNIAAKFTAVNTEITK